MFSFQGGLLLVFVFGSSVVANVLYRDQNGIKEDSLSSDNMPELCPLGTWCKPESNDVGNLLKQGEEKVKRQQCPPGVWGCKRESNNLGNLLKQDAEKVKRQQCPPGVWGCKRESNDVGNLLKQGTERPPCPPGLWC
uniref:Cnidarian restricted protein n=1 Tax=Clytia hemisphaerica TaxID=252671 RepID=A0A7M5WIK0_9CNID